jgi:hypothetical protein
LKHRHIPIFALAAALFLTAQPQVTAFAEPATHRAEYRISFIGLPVARADFTAKVDGDNFTVDGQLSSAGVANIMSRTEGQTSVSGVRRGDQLQASTYLMSYTSGRKSSRTEVAFRDGSVVSAELTPEKKRTRPDWIPIADGDMRSVLDPRHAALFRPKDSRARRSSAQRAPSRNPATIPSTARPRRCARRMSRCGSPRTTPPTFTRRSMPAYRPAWAP